MTSSSSGEELETSRVSCTRVQPEKKDSHPGIHISQETMYYFVNDISNQRITKIVGGQVSGNFRKLLKIFQTYSKMFLLRNIPVFFLFFVFLNL